MNGHVCVVCQAIELICGKVLEGAEVPFMHHIWMVVLFSVFVRLLGLCASVLVLASSWA